MPVSQAARRSFDFLERCLSHVAEHRPQLSLSAGGHVGHLRNRLSQRWPSPEQVHILFPSLSRHEAARVAWKIGGIEARNRILARYLEKDGDRMLPGLMPRPAPALSRLHPPLILGFFHVGAPHALGAVFEWLPVPVLALRLGLRRPAVPTLTVLTIEGSTQQRALVFSRAMAHLQACGVVASALDFVSGPSLTVPFLGRSLELARGPFAMARLAGAPLVPLAARWHGGIVEVEVGDELVADGFSSPEICERNLATAAAGWLENYLWSDPGEMGLGLLHRLVLSSDK
jgi:hypothetical protein